VRGLTNDERLVVFMNVYHALLIHTLIEVGHAKVSRRKLYRMYAYDVGGHVLTLAEIEHGILRAPLSRPVLMRNSFLGKFLVPRFGSSDPRFLLALTRPYPRISLCLATGTMSSPGTVQVFRTATLEAQLTAGARSYVASKVGFEAKVCVLNIILSVNFFFFFFSPPPSHQLHSPPPLSPVFSPARLSCQAWLVVGTGAILAAMASQLSAHSGSGWMASPAASRARARGSASACPRTTGRAARR
jgi:hypothetical protein